MIAAAWLHDVVEDTPVTLEDLHSEFGEGIAELVEALTDISRPEDGNRRKRKAIDREHLAHAQKTLRECTKRLKNKSRETFNLR
jgi:(p)ppGpp synthase/HD superfamily hydrolase